jgi:hypothetical protein
LRAQSAFAIAQIASSLVLLAGAGLLAKSFVRLQGVDAGFVRTESVAMDLSRLGGGREAWVSFFEDLLDRVEAPGGALRRHHRSSPAERRRGSALLCGRR